MGLIDEMVSGVKLARDVAQKLHDADLQNIVADLIVKAADLKLEIAELRSENIQLKDKLQEAMKKRDIRSKLEKRGNFYYLKEPVDGYAEGPFCLACMDSDGTLMSLAEMRSSRGTMYRCERCASRSKS